MTIDERMAVIESLLFASSTPLKGSEIAEVMGIDEASACRLVDLVADRLREHGHGIQVIRVAGGYQMATIAQNVYFVSQLSHLGDRGRLSSATLETLAVVAYRQPITRAEVEAVRGVQCASVLSNLVARGLIEEKGRKETVGRPIIYGTTDLFLRAFGLDTLSDLPSLKNASTSESLLDIAVAADLDPSE